jgi:hypothetical protein
VAKLRPVAIKAQNPGQDMVCALDSREARCPCREGCRSGASTIFFLVKVLANGELSKSLTVAVDKVSGGAKKKIEAAGGTVEVSA